MINEPLYAEIAYRKPPFYPAFSHFSSACFFGTLLTDIAYWRTAQMTWANFSAWLLTAGLVLGGISLVICIVDWFLGRLVGFHRVPAIYLIGNLAVLVISFFNVLVHSRDAWTSVVPLGIALSALAVVVLLAVGIYKRAGIYRAEKEVRI